MNAVSALWLFLAEISVLLAATSLSMTMLGIFRRGKIGLRTSQLLIVLGVFAFFGTLVSAGYVSGAGHWAAMDCGSPNPWKCNLSQATEYVNFYFIPSLLVSILVVSSGMGNLALSERLSLNRDLPRGPTNVTSTT